MTYQHSTGHAVPSPSGQYVASQNSDHVYIQYAHSLSTAFTFALDSDQSSLSATTIGTISARPEIPLIQWSHTSHHVLLLTTKAIRVFSLSNTERTIHITNGSAGLGRIIAAEMLGLDRGSEQLFVVWEFGRVAVWDLSTGRAAEELGDVKLGSGRLSSCWGIRRERGKAEVLALLSRTSAQDALSLYLPPSTTPFQTITLPTTDAQSIAWSGSWLSVLDSPLASPAPSLYILTPDGHLFRTYPSPPPLLPTDLTEPPSPQEEPLVSLGPASLAWSNHHLALASSTSSEITLLSTRAFTPSTTLSPTTTAPEFCHQEHLSSSGKRSYTFLSGSAIPVPSSSGSWSALGPAQEMKFNLSGTRLAVRYEGMPSMVLVWQITVPPQGTNSKGLSVGAAGKGAEKWRPLAPSMILQHERLRRTVWHPVRESLLLLISDEEAGRTGAGAGAGGGGPLGPTSAAVAPGSAPAARGVYLLDANIDAPPLRINHALSSPSPSETGKIEVHWISEQEAGGERLRVLVSSRKAGWLVLYPEGRDQEREDGELNRTARPLVQQQVQAGDGAKVEDGGAGQQYGGDDEAEVGDDSLFDILTGRTPLPALGSGVMIRRGEDGDVDHDDDDEIGGGLEDTFREKNRRREDMDDGKREEEVEVEPEGNWDDEMF